MPWGWFVRPCPGPVLGSGGRFTGPVPVPGPGSSIHHHTTQQQASTVVQADTHTRQAWQAGRHGEGWGQEGHMAGGPGGRHGAVHLFSTLSPGRRGSGGGSCLPSPNTSPPHERQKLNYTGNWEPDATYTQHKNFIYLWLME